MSETPAPAPAPVFDVDARKSAYAPMAVRFRGQDYLFGASALSILQAMTTSGKLDREQGETEAAYSVRLLAALPGLVATLCPGFPAPPWSVDEEVALFEVVTEVLRRVGEIRFQATAG